MLTKPHKAKQFLSAHPVFTRAEFAAAFGHEPKASTVANLLAHHARAGHIKRVGMEVYATVPAHLPAEQWVVDRFAAASKLRSDGVLAYHSALELHGLAYSEFNEVQLVSEGRTQRVELSFGACRFIKPLKALARKAHTMTVLIDRHGVHIRVTAVERTVVDVLHRSELAGGVEEVLESLKMVKYLDPEKVADYALLLKNHTVAAVTGWWLESRRNDLGVTDAVLNRLRKKIPQSKHYALGATPGNAVWVDAWRVLLPLRAVDSSFEGT